MAETKQKKYLKNIVFSILSKTIIFALGIIIPRLIILNYGSGLSGLLSSVGDIYTYIALIEAGVGVAATQALYKPLAEHNKEQTSSVLVATRNYFRRLIKWYMLAVIVFSAVYPLISKNDFSYPLVFCVIFVQGISNVLTYYFVSTLTQLLVADGREYVSSVIGLITFTLNSAIKIVLLSCKVSLVIVQCGYLAVNLINIVIVNIYVKKKYPWINWNAPAENDALAKRNKYMLNGIAWTIFSSTDTILISVFCGFAVTSIYSVYNLVFSSLSGITIMFYSGTYFILGQTFHESKVRFAKMYTEVETLLTGLSFSLFSVTYVLILPFVALYTKGADIQYVDKYLPVLFCLVQIISNSRLLSGHVVNIHNQPQMINKDSIIEMALNIIVSITFVIWLGIYGVLIGTIVALVYKTIRLIYVANKKLIGRSPWKTYRMYLVNLLGFGAVILFNHFLPPAVDGYLTFILYGVIYTVAFTVFYLILNLITTPSIITTAIDFIKGIKTAKNPN